MKRMVIYAVTTAMLMSCQQLRNNFEVSSPDGEVRVEIALNSEGGATYNVHFRDELLVKNARLGLVIDGEDYSSGFRVKSSANTSFRETWKPVWGQFAEIENSYNQLSLTLTKNSNTDVTLIFRAFNDGIGFRYSLDGKGSAVISDELTQFNMASDNMAWWVAPCWENDEYVYMSNKLSEMSVELRNQSAFEGHATHFACETGFNTPVTMRTPNGTYLSIHEAAIWNYPGSSLCLNPISLEINMSPAGQIGQKAEIQLPFNTPWRTITVAEKPGDLIVSNLILNLNDPLALSDVSFIKPMKYIGIWWEMHVGISTWELEGSKNHGANTANVKKYIDFAAKNGIQGVLVEGWNKGWQGWKNFNFTQPYPDFDIDAITEYAAQKGVQIIGHHETGGDVINYINQMEDAYRFYQNYGIQSLKSGYVGKIPGQFHYDQWMVNHYNDAVIKAAKNRITLNVHEPIKPSGISRTYPNLMTGEGMRGQEFNAWSAGLNLNHNVTLPFTRNLAGPMDYTPGIFDIKLVNSRNTAYRKLKTDEERRAFEFKHRVRTTLAHQLGLYVVFYSPLQMAADLPENYEGHEAFQFIRDVPVDWADTRVLGAQIAEYCVIARKDKESSSWFVGGITNAEARNFTVDCSFLSPDGEYMATIYADAKDADWDLNPTRYQITTQRVRRGDAIEVYMAPGGGFAISIMPVN